MAISARRQLFRCCCAPTGADWYGEGRKNPSRCQFQETVFLYRDSVPMKLHGKAQFLEGELLRMWEDSGRQGCVMRPVTLRLYGGC